MKKLLIMTSLVLILVLEVSAIQIKSNLLEFANIAANTNKTQILISGSLKPDDYYFFTDQKQVNVTLSLFKKMVELQGLRFLKLDDFYFVDIDKSLNANSDFNSTSYEEPENLYYIKMQGNSFAELNAMLNQYDKNATYIAQDNAAVIKATEKQYSEILSYLPNFDNKIVEQIRFKITILETDLSDLRKRGTEVNSLLKAVDSKDFRFFFNMITVPYIENSNVITQAADFYGVLNFLDQNSITKIKSSPFVVAKSNSEVFFSSVKTIPFLKNTSTFNQYSTQSQNTYDYKDVGLTLKLRPVVVGSNIDVDLDLTFENLLANSDKLTPSTSKKQLKSSYRLNRGEIIVLSGINQDIETKGRTGIPLLKDIWLLKYLFSTETTDLSNSILTITIEIVDDEVSIAKVLEKSKDDDK
ncbi:type II secretion system protein GspD [Campylobacter magnus]|uniref:type II secretion system protein GspD n=1 Tax=Campylobacter magnus TaxID=3026462 RepID=UPI002360C754|nr:type II and III secretion system protein [Campylobacter magnus]MDD0855036.1 type II and III secretion system protein [Campylobacter magnus]